MARLSILLYKHLLFNIFYGKDIYILRRKKNSKNISFFRTLRHNNIAMRSKNIFGLITFFATFAISAFIALLFAAPKFMEVPPVVTTFEVKTYKHNRCGTAYKIKEFLKRDKQNGLARSNADEFSDDASGLSSRAESVAKYAYTSSKMDVRDFPRDFQIVWNQHMQAWRNHASFLEKESNKREISEDFDQLEAENVSEINSTWQEVLSVGREYGADLPEGF
jgi:hypothetical protein